MFLTASEACWRRASAPNFSGGGLVVAIGYPLDNHFLFSARRNYDLTPPSGTSPEATAAPTTSWISSKAR